MLSPSIRTLLAAAILTLALAVPATAQPAFSRFWSDVSPALIAPAGTRLITPTHYRALALDRDRLSSFLAQAPLSGTPGEATRPELELPLPEGGFGRFAIEESPILAPALQARYPEIRTYAGYGLDDPSATVRFDLTPAGFHALILSTGGSIYIDPLQRGDVIHYQSYYRRDFTSSKTRDCTVLDEDGMSDQIARLIAQGAPRSGTQLLTYRAAVAATGEYTLFQGGTVPAALAAITTTMNRVDGVYQREVSIHFVLIPQEDQIIYTDPATDPYTNDNGNTMLDQNQQNLDAVIGSAGYDIGHVFSTGGGGIAALGSVCRDGVKAQGVTGSDEPVGDPFDIDYVSHEMGHQFGGNHPFNGTQGSCGGGNRNASTAYEPGSGSTIMGYAGVCGSEDLQPHTDDYFAWISLKEIIAYSRQGEGRNCPMDTPNGVIEPVVHVPLGTFTIPINTPFTLYASATTTGTPTFCWEESDLGPEGSPDNPSGNAPIFRSFPPTSNPSRTFPRLTDILSNRHTMGELLPTYARDLSFKVTVRDGQAGGVGIADDSVAVSVSSAGPFRITSPNTPVIWRPGSTQTVAWDVAGTDAVPIYCQTVNILFSPDGGFTFPYVLAAGTPNDGSQEVVLPDRPIMLGRIKVEAADNIFFDITDADLEMITGAPIAAWGDNSLGECSVPLPDTGFVAVSAGALHSLGLRSDGSILAWGSNTQGQCTVPAPDTGFVAVSGGHLHSLGLKSDGSIVAWGFNNAGQCDVPAPNSGFVAIAAGGSHSLGLKSDGSVVAWGNGLDGQCDVPAPNTAFVAIAAGERHSLGVKADGSIVAWGWNQFGQCSVPAPNTGFVAVAAGQGHSLGLKADGSIVAWGYNADGECNVPAPNTDFVALATGGFHSLGLKSDGSVVAWGQNTYGQCNVPAPNTLYAAVAANTYHSLVLKVGISLSPFSLVAPADQETLLTTEPTLQWQASHTPDPTNTIRYVVSWSEDPGFSNSDSLETGTDTTGTVLPDLMHVQKTYYWRVKALDLQGHARWCDPPTGWSFYIEPETPVLLQPTAAPEEDGILVSWNVHDGAGLSGYRVYRRVESSDWVCLAQNVPAGGESCRYLDTGVEPGVRYEYEIEAFGPGGSAGRFGPVSAEMTVPARLSLTLRPNPGADAVTLTFALPRPADVLVRFLDVQGREVARVSWNGLRAGVHRQTLRPQDAHGHALPSGAYLVRIETPSGHKTARWVVVR